LSKLDSEPESPARCQLVKLVDTEAASLVVAGTTDLASTSFVGMVAGTFAIISYTLAEVDHTLAKLLRKLGFGEHN